ncbi:hypothetical protein [Actinokineospora bangkokensis]|uniref:hypothetical protein n=1 Tax=Actinokineospora bangkokensis TaxID=1193682 RepID=UPI0011787799|nr:hypothetical protein [Actinokineospora bangkokensis]
MGRPLSVAAWLVLPLLFAAAVLALTAAGGLLLDATWPVTLSSWLGGGAAAIAAALAPSVNWRGRRQRLVLPATYPLLLLTAGLASDAVAVPQPVGLALGAPALLAVVVGVARRLRRPTPRPADTESTVVIPTQSRPTPSRTPRGVNA